MTLIMSHRIYFLCLLRRAAKPPNDIVAVFCSIIRSILEYSYEVWHPYLTKQQSATTEHLKKQTLLIDYPNLEYKEVLEVALIAYPNLGYNKILEVALIAYPNLGNKESWRWL